MSINQSIWAVLAVAVPLTISTPAQAWDNFSTVNDGVIIVPPDARPFGMTMGEWSARWWQWVFMQPADRSPFNWPNTNDCSTGQLGPVWFLVGFDHEPSTVRCNIPEGKVLFFPIINSECSNLEEDPYKGATPQERRRCAERDQQGVVKLTATIDGRPINGLRRHVAQSPDFDVVFPPNGLLGATGAFGQAASYGYYLMVAPLQRGEHTIHFEGEIINPFVRHLKIKGTYKLNIVR